MPTQRIALFGGTFDPIHFGHLLLAVRAYEVLDLNRVIFIPARQPPHKNKPVACPGDRLEMIRLAIAGDQRFLVCDCELSRPEPSYTIDTVRHVQESMGRDNDWFWIIGSDMLPDLNTWYKASDLLELVSIVVFTRTGYAQLDLSCLSHSLTGSQIERIKANIIEVPLVDISSTDIRQRLARKRSLRYFLPAPVADYIAKRRLYPS